MEYRIRLADRYRETFGFLARNITPRVADAGIGRTTFFNDLDVFRAEAPDEVAVYDILDIIPDGNDKLAYTFELPVLIETRQRKIYKSKVINPSSGSKEAVKVIESAGWDTHEIRIQGFWVDDIDHRIPYAKLEEFKDLMRAYEVFQIRSQFLRACNINRIHFTDMNHVVVDRFIDTIAFTVSAEEYRKPIPTLKDLANVS